jgi:hypothetical protein
MAVTQQLARLGKTDLDRCRRSVQALDDLCSFRLLAASEHLDLDWSPRPLERLAVRLDSALATAIEQACCGGAEVNPAYKAEPHAVWEHPVRALEPAAVTAVSSTLSCWAPDDLMARLPADAIAARGLVAMDDFEGHPRSYLAEHFSALRNFYAVAAEAGLAVAAWWD